MVASVIVDDFHLMGFAIAPAKADPPTLVDADAVLARPFDRAKARHELIGEQRGRVPASKRAD
jgi:hypothetical protein